MLLQCYTINTIIYTYTSVCSLEYGCEIWNTNKSQDKVLESIQLRAGKYILACFVTTCDEPVRADLQHVGLETLKSKRDFHELKWYCRIKQMNNQNLPCKLLINRWDNANCRSHPRKFWLAEVDLLMKDLDLQDRELAIKIIREAIDKRECRQFETTLQYKSKLRST